MNISIAPEFEQFINSKIKAGVYSSADEMVNDALRLLAERDEHRQSRIKKLNQEIERGLEVISEEESKSRIDKLFKSFENS